MKKNFVITLLIVTLFTFTEVPAYGQITNIEKQEISGKVIKKDGEKITIETKNGIQEITIPTNISIIKDSKAVTINDINVNDSVQATTNTSGQILSIDDTSAAMLNTRNMALLIGALLLIGIIFALVIKRKTNQGHIKTTVGNTPATT